MSNSTSHDIGITAGTNITLTEGTDTFEIATSENSISSIVEKQSSYQDLKYSIADLPEFSSFAVKVIMRGVDPSFVPKIQDIRAVASF